MALMPEKPADEPQTFARHNRLTCGGMAQVMQAQAAELRVRANRAPARNEAGLPPRLCVARKQVRIRVAHTGQRGDVRPRGRAERDRARAGLRIGYVDRVLTNVAAAQIEQFASAASDESQQPDGGDGLGPAAFDSVERAPEPGQLVPRQGTEQPASSRS